MYDFRPKAHSIKYILTEAAFIEYYKFGISKEDIEAIVNFIFENENFSVLLYKLRNTINEIYKLNI
jgi:hypothetical protein